LAVTRDESRFLEIYHFCLGFKVDFDSDIMAVVIDTARLQLQELDIDTHLNDLHEVESDERIATLLKACK
jgi:hypothetical protein